jgi:IS30 family transposase
MSQYHRLNVNEREEISLGIEQGSSQYDIAISLSRSPSTICHEINRNTKYRQQYRAIQAQRRTIKFTHLARKNRKMDINLPLKHYVLEHLDQLWSPEQIAKRLKYYILWIWQCKFRLKVSIHIYMSCHAGHYARNWSDVYGAIISTAGYTASPVRNPALYRTI